MQQHPILQIPTPCHADWDTMTPDAQGRHCALCDKTVRDFTGMTAEAIIAEITQTNTKVCGRVNRSAINRPLSADVAKTCPPPSTNTPPNARSHTPTASATHLQAQAWMRFPMERLRVFVLAFVLVFGLEVWGISKAQAQTVQPAVDKLKNTQNLQAAVQDTAKEIRLQGKVVDVYTREPVEMAQVSVYENERFLQGTFTDAEGKFSLTIPKDAVTGETYDLHLSYNGKTRRDLHITKDAREFLFLIDAYGMMEEVTIMEPLDLRQITLMGAMVTTYTICEFQPASGWNASGGALFRPLDEWLMMNFSEINIDGRW